MARPAGFIVASYGQKSKMEMKLSWNGNKPHSLRVIIKWDCSMWVVYGVTLTTSLSCILSSIKHWFWHLTRSHDFTLSYFRRQIMPNQYMFFSPLRNTSNNSEEFWNLNGHWCFQGSYGMKTHYDLYCILQEVIALSKKPNQI